jgi:uncharacterized phage-associated protein
MLSCFDVAKFFIVMTDEDAGDSISHLKLQKLAYYAQGFHLAMHGTPLFPEKVFAWAHGPVVKELYHEYKHFGAAPIKMDPNLYDSDIYTTEQIGFLMEVNTVYGQFSATKLRNMTHQEPPWKDTPQGEEISHRAMKDYFKTLVIEDED